MADLFPVHLTPLHECFAVYTNSAQQAFRDNADFCELNIETGQQTRATLRLAASGDPATQSLSLFENQPISPTRLAVLTSLAMLAFAGNSILCRIALADGSIDAASFTSIRLLSGAGMLGLLVTFQRQSRPVGGSWRAAGALFIYAAGFSFAYVNLSAATGALLLFGSVQATMIGFAYYSGERFNRPQLIGVIVALGGLAGLLLPGLEAPPLSAAALMISAGAAWGVYSILGRGTASPTQATAGNFIRAVPFAFLLSLLFLDNAQVAPAGVAYAVASGALASGAGYALWYYALPSLSAGTAATVQLTVPVIAAIGGVVLLNESITLRLLVASIAILGGVALFLVNQSKQR